MKRILILIIGLIGVAQAQYAPTSAKTRFVNGLALGTKLDAYFNAADSNAIYWRADSVVMAKYKGAARALAFASALGSYKLIADTFFTSGYTTRARTKQVIDSLGNSITSKTGILWGNGTSVNGSLYTFSNDSTITFRSVPFLQNISTTQNPAIYSLFLGYGAGGNFSLGTKGYANTAIGYYAGGALQSNVTSEASSNTLVGYYAGAGITTGTANTSLGTAALGSPNANKTVAIGWHSMESATNGDNAVAIGSLSLQYNTSLSEHVAVGANSLRNNSTGLRNTAVGYNALNANTTGNYNVAMGWDAMGDDAVGDYNTVIGYNAGNSLFAGSNNTIIGARVSPGSVNNSIVLGNGNGTVKAYHNNSSWDLYDTVKALAFQSIGGITTGATSYIKGNSVAMVMSNTGAGNFNTWQLLGGSAGTSYNWEFSKDNAVSNNFEIAPSTAVGGTIFATSVFRLGITGNLTLSGNLTAKKIIGNSSTPSISGGSATYIGTGASTSVSGNDMAGEITLVTGTGCGSTGASNRSALSVTFSSAYTTAPIVQIQAIQQGGLSSTDGPTNQTFFLRRDAVGTNGFTVYLPVGTALTDSTTYLITYQVIGR